MKFETNRADFYQALQRVIGVIPSKTTIPILGNILCQVETDQLRLTGTDLEVSIITSMNVSGASPGAVTIPAKKIYDIVRELPDVPLAIGADDNFRVTISSDKGRYRLSGESSDEYPQIALGQAESTFNYSVAKFLRMVAKTQFAVSLDELRTTLMGVLLEIRESEMRMVATDGARLARFSDHNFKSAKPGLKVIIPNKTLHLLARISEQQANIEIIAGENHIIFKTPQSTLFSKLISGQYPNYERVIPTDNILELTLERDALAAALRRVSLFANQTTQQVRFSVTKNSLTVQAEDEQIGGEAKEAIPASFSGEDMEVGYNSQYLLEILRHVDTQDVLFELKEPSSAVIIRPVLQTPDSEKDGEEQLMLLMPIRLNDAAPAGS